MATDTGILTQGTLFEVSNDEGVTYIPFGCVTSFTLTSGTRTEIPTTCLTDTTKTFKFGLQDAGTLSVDTYSDLEGAGTVDLENSYESDIAYDFKISYSNDNEGAGTPTIKEFQGYVISFSENGTEDSILTTSWEIKISGTVSTTDSTPGAWWYVEESKNQKRIFR